MMKAALLCLVLMMAGCAVEANRYQLSTNAAGNGIWRLDTWTGEMEACGYESAKPVCHQFPAPTTRR